MSKERVITKEMFDELLAWLDADRERAGETYERIRRSLIKIFTWRGCSNSEGLADETIDRVAQRARELRARYDGDPALYFYGVAKRLIKEEHKNAKLKVALEETSGFVAPAPQAEEEDSELVSECLQLCLQELSADDRDLIMAYYLKEKQAKIDYRKDLARRLGVSTNTLRVRVYRLRAALGDCIERCVGRRAPDEMD